MTRIPHLLLLVCVLAATTTTLSAAASKAKHSLPAYRKKYPFVRDASAAPKAKEYDYIIVGGGAAGCPLAATLSSSKSVLLLERGRAPWGVATVERVDGFHHNLLYSDNSTSVAQAYRTEDGVLVHRARVLGGGSAINAGFYTRASPAEVSMFGWNGADVNTSYAWVEKIVAFKPVLPPWQSALKQALLVAGVVPDNGFTFDHVVGTKVGGVIFDEAGKRHTAADLLQYAQPRNIDVRIHATVHRILFDVPKAGGKPRATGVVYTDRKGVTHTATVKPPGEVILSAGAVGSPQLLQLSGVGPKEQLQKLGIPVLVDNPEVGQGMADNPNNVFLNAGETPQPYSLVDVVGITDFGSYIEELSGGPNTTGLIQCFIQMLKDPSKVVDPTYLPLVNSPPPIIMPFLPQVTYIVQKVSGPRSKGHMTLLSTDVKVGPSVRYNYYQDPEDLAVCVQAVKVISKAVRTPQFSKFNYQKSSEVPQTLGLFLQVASGFVPPQDTSNITALQQYCLDTVVTIWHAHGGCLVDKVVDHDRKVLGVDALRVIDISTMNATPGANPQATMMMLGRYMGLQILERRHSG